MGYMCFQELFKNNLLKNFKNHHLVNNIVIMVAVKYHQWILNLVGKNMKMNRIFV